MSGNVVFAFITTATHHD